MKIQDLFEDWGLQGLELNAGFLKMNWEPKPDEQQAAWDLYIELLTRVTVQELSDQQGDEASALQSVYALFGITRELLKQKGRKCETFSKIAIVILNQKIRPFTAKWHKKKLAGAFALAEECTDFRQDLKKIQIVLRSYCGLLSAVAKVEDFQKLEEGPLQRL